MRDPQGSDTMSDPFSTPMHLAGLVTPGAGPPAAATGSSVGSTTSMPSLDATSGPATSDMNERVMNAMREICKNYGGPRQFLLHHLASEELKRDFHEKLLKLIPMSEGTIEYQQTLPLPESEPNSLDKPFTRHPS